MRLSRGRYPFTPFHLLHKIYELLVNISLPSTNQSMLSIAGMNDTIALDLYGQLLIFRDISPQNELLFDNPDSSKHSMLCTLAQFLNLHYHFCRNPRQAKLSRPQQAPILGVSNLNAAGRLMPALNGTATSFVPVSEEFLPIPASFDTPLPSPSFSYAIGTAADSLSQIPSHNELSAVGYERTLEESSPVSAEALDNERLPTSRAAISRSSSMHSISSSCGRDRIRKFFGRTSSVESTSKSRSNGFSFDSKSNGSAQRISACPGRRGPLSEVARATARAVKALKACWRCKILRKGVSNFPQRKCTRPMIKTV